MEGYSPGRRQNEDPSEMITQLKRDLEMHKKLFRDLKEESFHKSPQVQYHSGSLGKSTEFTDYGSRFTAFEALHQPQTEIDSRRVHTARLKAKTRGATTPEKYWIDLGNNHQYRSDFKAEISADLKKSELHQSQQTPEISASMSFVNMRPAACFNASFKARWLLSTLRQTWHKDNPRPSSISEDAADLADPGSSNVRDRFAHQAFMKVIQEKRKRLQRERERKESLERKRIQNEEWIGNRPKWDNSVKITNPQPKDESAGDLRLNFCGDVCDESCDCYPDKAKVILAGSSSQLISEDIGNCFNYLQQKPKTVNKSREKSRGERQRSRHGSKDKESDMEATKKVIYKPEKKSAFQKNTFTESSNMIQRSPLRWKGGNDHKDAGHTKKGISGPKPGERLSKNAGNKQLQCRSQSVNVNFHCLSEMAYETPNLKLLYESRREDRSRSQVFRTAQEMALGRSLLHRAGLQSRNTRSQHAITDEGERERRNRPRQTEMGERGWTPQFTGEVGYEGFIRDLRSNERYAINLTKIS